jgi:hypothetical protein
MDLHCQYLILVKYCSSMDLHCQYLIPVKYCSIFFTVCLILAMHICLNAEVATISEKNPNGFNTRTSIYWIYSFYHLGGHLIGLLELF